MGKRDAKRNAFHNPKTIHLIVWDEKSQGTRLACGYPVRTVLSETHDYDETNCAECQRVGARPSRTYARSPDPEWRPWED